jgi:hypothetical protein
MVMALITEVPLVEPDVARNFVAGGFRDVTYDAHVNGTSTQQRE